MALTEAQEKLLDAAREVAIELGERGKVLTGLIGELSACSYGSLKWEPSDGYDARVGDLQVEVETARCPRSGETIGWFGRRKEKGYSFAMAMYVELDSDYKVAGIWHMGSNEIKDLEGTETSTWGLRINRFKARGEILTDTEGLRRRPPI